MRQRRGADDDSIIAFSVQLGVMNPGRRHMAASLLVDLLGGLRGLDPKAFSRGIEVPFLGDTLRFVGREDFIAMKCFADGPQDLLDAKDAYGWPRRAVWKSVACYI
jgi:hypothetical protein